LGQLTEFSHEEGQSVTRCLTPGEQKSLGQFMTPPSIALTMARRACSGLDLDVVRILEPAAGSGILAAAVVEILLSREAPPSRIELTLREVDARLIPVLRQLGQKIRRLAKLKNVSLSISVRGGDFLLSDIATKRRERYDLVIANPPYFKLNKKAPQAVAHAYAVYGQPNIYGLFMAASSQLLAPGGRWCFITPRSWTNGSYFAAVRRHMLAWLRIDAMHVFESREAHFTDDVILQEAMITWATAQVGPAPDIVVSTSQGIHDLPTAELRSLPAIRIVAENKERTIALPLSDQDGSLPCSETLGSLGLKVSTGPVVAFRASRHLSEGKGKKTVPLLWMQHVSRMAISWPIDKKREHIAACVESAWMLVPNTPMVLLRRFSPKEDVRRVTAAAYTGGLSGAQIGLENHLNYIYRPGGTMNPVEAIGIAAYLNSRHVDVYFRSVAGSTQVNAAELRQLPMPTLSQIMAIGKRCFPGMALSAIDSHVESILGEREIAA
jgi:adenine-specific DNA-methyltransferase